MIKAIKKWLFIRRCIHMGFDRTEAELFYVHRTGGYVK